MADDAVVDVLTRIDARTLKLAAFGGLLGGTVLFLIMGSYEAAKGMTFASILNACFAAFVFKNAGMAPTGHQMMGEHRSGASMSGSAGAMHHGSTMAGGSMGGHDMMMSNQIVASHLTVGSVLHVAMSVTAGVAFVIALALAIRLGLRALATPAGYILGGATGGALLYVIMMYVVAPSMNSMISDFTPRTPFFLAHVAFGATVGAFVYATRLRAAQPLRAGARGERLDYNPAH